MMTGALGGRDTVLVLIRILDSLYNKDVPVHASRLDYIQIDALGGGGVAYSLEPDLILYCCTRTRGSPCSSAARVQGCLFTIGG